MIKHNAEDEEAFDVLYCIAFELMDAQWLAMHASYMEFNVHSLCQLSTILCSIFTLSNVFCCLSVMNRSKFFSSPLTCWVSLFQEVVRVTRTQLERELSLEDVHRIQDLPAYNLLYR